MTRFLLLMLLGWLVLRALGRATSGAFVGTAPGSRRDPVPAVETLAPCASCGVYAPRGRMIERSGERFCSDACSRAPRAESS